MDTIGAICYMTTQKQRTLQILLKDLEEYEYGNLNLHIRTGSSDIVVCEDNFKEPYWKHLVPGTGIVGLAVFHRLSAYNVFAATFNLDELLTLIEKSCIDLVLLPTIAAHNISGSYPFSSRLFLYSITWTGSASTENTCFAPALRNTNAEDPT